MTKNKKQVVMVGGETQMREWNEAAQEWDYTTLDERAFEVAYGCHPAEAHDFYPEEFQSPA